jgi:hypothetical protein
LQQRELHSSYIISAGLRVSTVLHYFNDLDAVRASPILPIPDSMVNLASTLSFKKSYLEHLQQTRYNADDAKKSPVYRAWRRNCPSSRRGIRGGAAKFLGRAGVCTIRSTKCEASSAARGNSSDARECPTGWNPPPPCDDLKFDTNSKCPLCIPPQSQNHCCDIHNVVGNQFHYNTTVHIQWS